ncbi:hypothetical protein Taro_033092 [Colocasia esculenta]|uniref:Uncharacterized protein n=1 Tax=Colocasia esculenta TaxID=4460 RepID=A0A843W3R9_COLES|nr:hypothetical protein [Colocasia esculenta]
MTLHHDLHAARYFFNPTIQYKDNVHNDGEVMRGTMNVITRLAKTMNERLDAMAEVETRAKGEIPDLHPDDRLVQACEEDVLLEEHVLERGERLELRRSATIQGTRLSSSQPELRRSTSQLEPKGKKDKGKKKAKANKERRTEEPRRKSQEGAEDSPEESQETHIGEPFSEAPPLPAHLAKLYEAEKKHYQRRKKMIKKGKTVGSDDSTQSPDDDDGAAAGTGATGGYGLGGIISKYEDYSAPPHQQQGSQGEAQQQHGGYEGQ